MDSFDKTFVCIILMLLIFGIVWYVTDCIFKFKQLELCSENNICCCECEK